MIPYGFPHPWIASAWENFIPSPGVDFLTWINAMDAGVYL